MPKIVKLIILFYLGFGQNVKVLQMSHANVMQRAEIPGRIASNTHSVVVRIRFLFDILHKKLDDGDIFLKCINK